MLIQSTKRTPKINIKYMVEFPRIEWLRHHITQLADYADYAD